MVFGHLNNMPTYKVGQAPWEISNNNPTSFKVGEAPWETTVTQQPQTESPGILKQIGNALISSERQTGETIGQSMALGTKAFSGAVESAQNLSDTQLGVLKRIQEKKRLGEDTSRLERALASSLGKEQVNIQDIAPATQKTNLQALADVGGIGLDVLTAGTLKPASGVVKTLKTVKASRDLSTAEKLIQIAKTTGGASLAGGAIGYGYDVTGKLQAGETGTGALTPGLGTAIGATVPVLGGTLKAITTVSKAQAPKIINSLIKPLAKDFSYGKNPGRAVAEEGIVGNSLDDLAKNISVSRSTIGEQLSSTADKLEGKSTVDISNSLNSIDEAITKANKTPKTNASLIQRLQDVKDDLLGAIDTKDTSFSNALNAKRIIGDVTKWTGNVSDDKAVNMALKRAYGNIKESLNTSAMKADPTLGKEFERLNEKYADLTSAEIATKYRDIISQRKNLISMPIKAGGVAGVIAGIASGGTAIPILLASVSVGLLDKALESTAVKSRVAAWLAKESPEVVAEVIQKNPGIGSVLENAITKEYTPIENAIKTFKNLPNKQGGKISWDFSSKPSPELRSSVEKELSQYDVAPMNVTGMKPKSNAYNIDDNFRLGQLQDKYNTGKKLTDAEIKEAGGLLSKGSVNADETIAKVGQTADSKLLQEAKKYKSAEEFVKAQGQSVFRGGDTAIDTARGSGRGISVSDKETAGLFTPPEGGLVDEAILPKTAKILKEGDIPKNLQDAYIKEAQVLADPKNFSTALQKSVIEKQQAIIEYARKNGFDAVDFPFEKEIRVVKPNVLKTKSQLTDIWNKAQPTKGVDPLIQEARKYKSAEEFIKKQPVVYHGSQTPLKKFSNEQGTFFTDDMMNAEGYAGGENVYEGYLNLKNPLIIDAKGALHRELNTKWGKTTQEIVGKVDKTKYDGVIFKNIKDSWIDDAEMDTPSTIYYAFKPKDAFLNESQLTDIWNKANKK